MDAEFAGAEFYAAFGARTHDAGAGRFGLSGAHALGGFVKDFGIAECAQRILLSPHRGILPLLEFQPGDAAEDCGDKDCCGGEQLECGRDNGG